MTWTTEKPIEPGWYWWREDDLDRVMVVLVDKTGGIIKLEDSWMNSISGEWAGPLEPPT